MKPMRLKARKPVAPKQSKEGKDGSKMPSDGRYAKGREGNRIVTPRNLHRVRSHSLGRAMHRDRMTPEQDKKQQESRQQGPLEQEKAFLSHDQDTPRPKETVRIPTPRKSQEWRKITTQLHRRMETKASASDNRAPPKPQFEISPAARSILAKKDQQRRRNKSSNASQISGKSKGTHTTATQNSVNSSARSDASSRNRSRPRTIASSPKTKNATLNEETPSDKLGGLIPVSEGGNERLTIYAINNKQQKKQLKPESKPNTEQRHIVADHTKYAKPIVKKMPIHQPMETTTVSKKRHPSRGRKPPKQDQMPTTPKLKPKRRPPVSDRSVTSYVSAVAPVAAIKNPGEQTVTLNVDSVKVIMADRQAAAIAAEQGIPSQVPDNNNDTSKTEEELVSLTPTTSIFSILACTHPTVDPELFKAEERQKQHKRWLEYAKRAIFEAKHGIESEGTVAIPSQIAPKPGTKKSMRDLTPAMLESMTDDEKQAEFSVQADTTDGSSDEDEIRSISSVDLLVRWIGNCGEPDLSDHYPPTQRQRLALHQAARSARGHVESRHGSKHDDFKSWK